MKQKHIVTLALAFGALGLMIANVDHWEDVFRPGFVGGAMVSIAATVKGMYQGGPNEDL